MQKQRARVKEVLDKLFEKYSKQKYIDSDPVKYIHRYKEKCDVEIAAFIASSFAFGRVEQINEAIERILRPMGENPYEFVKGFCPGEYTKRYKGFKYRFIKDKDLNVFLQLAALMLRQSESIEKFFLEGYKKGKGLKEALNSFVKRVFELATSFKVFQDIEKKRAVKFLFSTPESDSPRKRLNLFLRWMVRRDEVDVGIWRKVMRSDLIIPLDTHIAKVSRWIGLTRLKSPRWAMAETITESLREFDRDDPVKYDFALTRPGIINGCTGGKSPCNKCDLEEICSARSRKI